MPTACHDDHEVTHTVWLRGRRYAHPGFGVQFTRQVMNPPTRMVEGPGGRAPLLRGTGSGVPYPYGRGYAGVGRPLPAAMAGGVVDRAGRFRQAPERASRLPKLGALKVDPVTGRLAKGQAEPPEDGAAPGPRR